MAIVEGLKKLYSIRATKKFAGGKKNPIKPEDYAAWKVLHPLAGIYQRKHTKTGVQISVEKFYQPSNQPSQKQLARRQIFRDGFAEWRALDNDSKKLYDTLAYRLKFSGMNFYMRKYLNSHKS